ncbi:MAG TPA: MoaD/ThiS family protein [Chloroflexota bacterium]|nr:MoaD/ThiS family protein [Chloroflexota bacterium]
MEVEVKLYGQLRRYRPEGVAGAPHQPFKWLLVGGTAVSLAHELGIPDGLVNAVAVNGTAVDLDTPLHAADKVSLFPPSAGGNR